jgi:transcriptional regulator with XRE-family HTH domain
VARPFGAAVQRSAKTLEQAIGLVITEIRAREEISQSDLAHKLGYNTSYIGMIERGEKSMTLRTLEDLAGFFNTTSSGLLARAERRRRNANQS